MASQPARMARPNPRFLLPVPGSSVLSPIVRSYPARFLTFPCAFRLPHRFLVVCSSSFSCRSFFHCCIVPRLTLILVPPFRPPILSAFSDNHGSSQTTVIFVAKDVVWCVFVSCILPLPYPSSALYYPAIYQLCVRALIDSKP